MVSVHPPCSLSCISSPEVFLISLILFSHPNPSYNGPHLVSFEIQTVGPGPGVSGTREGAPAICILYIPSVILVQSICGPHVENTAQLLFYFAIYKLQNISIPYRKEHITNTYNGACQILFNCCKYFHTFTNLNLFFSVDGHLGFSSNFMTC